MTNVNSKVESNLKLFQYPIIPANALHCVLLLTERGASIVRQKLPNIYIPHMYENALNEYCIRGIAHDGQSARNYRGGVRARQFSQQGHVTHLEVAIANDVIFFLAACQASMLAETRYCWVSAKVGPKVRFSDDDERNMVVERIISADCTCKQGKLGHCVHNIAALVRFISYSKNLVQAPASEHLTNASVISTSKKSDIQPMVAGLPLSPTSVKCWWINNVHDQDTHDDQVQRAIQTQAKFLSPTNPNRIDSVGARRKLNVEPESDKKKRKWTSLLVNKAAQEENQLEILKVLNDI